MPLPKTLAQTFAFRSNVAGSGLMSRFDRRALAHSSWTEIVVPLTFDRTFLAKVGESSELLNFGRKCL